MKTIVTQAELERILSDRSISYPKCFADLKEVREDIQSSLLSHYQQYDISQIASKCYKYYKGPEFEFRGLGKRGWYRVVSDKKFWNSVWESKKGAGDPPSTALRPPFSYEAQWFVSSSTGEFFGLLSEGYLGGRVRKAFKRLTREDKAKIRRWLEEARVGHQTCPVEFLVSLMLRKVDPEELREIASRIGLLNEYIPSQVGRETVRIELMRLLYAYRGKIFGTL
jgi:hypothetical protein